MTGFDWTSLNRQKLRGRLYAALQPLDPPARAATLNTYLEQQVRFLVEADGKKLDKLARSFLVIGFDSLMSVDLLYNLQRDLDRELDPDVLEQESIDDLVVAVLKHLP